MSKRATRALAVSLLSAISSPALAQELPTWALEIFGRQGGGYRAPTYGERSAPFDEGRAAARARRAEGADVRNGGARPAIAPQAPVVVAFAYTSFLPIPL
jgi:hypothetical protein